MKRLGRFYKTACFVVMLLCWHAPESFGAELKPIWLTSACYQLRLSVSDKLSVKKTYIAKYIVKSSDGETYFAEKAAIAGDVTSEEVIFPDGFHNQKTKLQAYADCFDGQKYTWEIYADNVLIDSGTLEFRRKKRR